MSSQATSHGVDALLGVLSRYSFTFTREDELQSGIGSALDAEGIPFEREVALSPADRIDFLLPTGLGIEIKVAGTIPRVAYQLRRYAGSSRVCALLLVTTRHRHGDLPEALNGKPLRVLIARGGVQ